jgi:hypothetical protein
LAGVLDADLALVEPGLWVHRANDRSDRRFLPLPAK